MMKPRTRERNNRTSWQSEELCSLERLRYTSRGTQTLTRPPIIPGSSRTRWSSTIVEGSTSRYLNVHATCWRRYFIPGLIANELFEPVWCSPHYPTTTRWRRAQSFLPLKHPPSITTDEPSNCDGGTLCSVVQSIKTKQYQWVPFLRKCDQAIK